MRPSYPLKGLSTITQYFNSPWDRYKGGLHLGVDILPLDDQGRGWPAPVYPILDGTLRYFYEDYQGKNSKAIAIDTWLDEGLINYLKAMGTVPKDYSKRVLMVHQYLHGLNILDKDGEVSRDTPIMRCGNTGQVYTGTQPVPEEMKGVPPYPGLHLHLQCEVQGEDNNYFGTVDPLLILNYKKEINMTVYKQADKPTLYFSVGDVLVGFGSDFVTFQREFPNATIVELPPTEFNKFKVSSLVAK